MSSNARNTKIPTVIRGDKWDGYDFRLTIPDEPDFDFTGTVARGELRKERDGSKANNPVLHEFNINVDASTLGEATFSISLEGAVTDTLPIGKIYGDVEFTAPDGLGPYTALQFVINLKADTTR